VASITIRTATTDDVDTVLAFYRAAGWWEQGGDPATLPQLITGSSYFVLACADTGPVGMGRVISDNVSDAYIQDVFVAPAFRKQGVGAAIVTALRSECVRRGFTWIGLVAQPGTLPFYERLGFTPMPEHTLALLRTDTTGPRS
jgi:aralkylamine N-acetyltransferase